MTVNSELRAARTILGYLCDLDLLPMLTQEDLRRALKRFDAEVDPTEYLKPRQLQRLLEAAQRQDAATFRETRAEHRGEGERGATVRHKPIAPLVVTALLTGMRFNELLQLTWKRVDLEALDHDGRTVGEITLKAEGVKTGRGRVVSLEVSPALHKLLATMKLKAGGKGSVFGLTRGEAVAAMKRLKGEHGAPEESGWQVFRQTCASYLTCAPGIFGAAAAFRSARQLGHSIAVAEKNYLDLVRGISHEAKTLEAAMQISGEMQAIVGSIGKRSVVRAEVVT